jgi:hypothetical protein
MTCPNSAASIGDINVAMCHGSYGDSTPAGPRVLLTLAGEELRPGAVMLGHGNDPTAARIFPQIGELILLAVAC